MAFFTIVIPTFNRAEKIKLTIQSVLDQTFTDFELLVMDDGSIDNTREVIAGYGDARIKYDWANNSGGPATPRNRGIDASSAPWISFLDADDVWYPDRLAVLAEAIFQYPEIDVFCHNEMLSTIGSDIKTPLKYGPYEPDFYQVMLKQGNRLSTSAVTVRTEFLKSHHLRFNQRKDFVIVEDFDLWLHLANKNARFHFINQFLGEYVIESDNISLATSKNRHNLLVVLKEHVYNVQQFEPDKNKLWQEVNLFIQVQDAGECFKNRGIAKGLQLLLRIFFTHPLSFFKIMTAKLKNKAKQL